jgi:hypothetical protein
LRTLLFGTLGLLFWAATQFLALGIGAAGYGWMEPFWLSMALLVLYPLAFVRAFCVTEPWSTIVAGMLLVIAVTLDALMLGGLFLHGDIFSKQWNMYPDERWVPLLWFALWAGWQLLLLAAWIKRPGIDASPSH